MDEKERKAFVENQLIDLTEEEELEVQNEEAAHEAMVDRARMRELEVE